MRDSLTVLLPVHNLQAVLEAKVCRILDVLSDLTSRLELLIIDEGSDDGTEEISWDLAARFTQVQYVRHRCPVNDLDALRAGFVLTAGQYLLVLPNLPKLDIYQLVNCWRSRGTGVDPVAEPVEANGLRDHVEPGWLRRLTRWGEAVRAIGSEESAPAETEELAPQNFLLIRREDLTDMLLDARRKSNRRTYRWDSRDVPAPLHESGKARSRRSFAANLPAGELDAN